MLRSLIFFLLAIVVMILGLLIWLLTRVILLFDKKAPDRIVFRYISWVCRVFLPIAGGRLSVENREYIPENEAVLYVVNHRSIFDILILYSLLREPTGFVAKKEIKWVPLLGQWLLIAKGLFLDRDNIREGLKTIKKGINQLNNGISMAIFPEGTRNKDQESKTSMLPFHAGSLKLAERAEVPIVPAVIYNADNIFENHKPFLRRTEVKIRFLEPIPTKGLSKKEMRVLPDRIREIMQDALNDLDKAARQE